MIIWLAVALVLGAAALYVALRPSGSAAPPRGSVAANERVTEIDPAQVRAIEVRIPGQPVQRLERMASDPGQWTLTIGGSGPAWPLLPQRVRSILQIVAQVRAVAPAEANATVGDGATVVAFETDGGATHTLLLAERTLGGTGLVEYRPPEPAPARRAMVDDGFLNVFRNPGPRQWRDAAALPGVGPELSRIRVEGDKGNVIALSRAAGRWNLVEPVGAPANATKVAQVIAALQNLTITDFLDGKTIEPALTRLETPSARIRLETDVREATEDPTAPPRVWTHTQELALGGPADSSGKNLYALVRDGDQTRTVAVDAAGLAAALVIAPEAYVAPAAVATVAAEIGQVKLTPTNGSAGARTFKRSLNSWAEVLGDGREAQLAEGDAGAVNDALTFLTTRSAAGVHIGEPEGYMPAGKVSLSSLGGAPLEEVEVGVVPGGSLVVRTGNVWRAYGVEPSSRLLRAWVESSGAAPAEPSPPPPGDINK